MTEWQQIDGEALGALIRNAMRHRHYTDAGKRGPRRPLVKGALDPSSAHEVELTRSRNGQYYLHVIHAAGDSCDAFQFVGQDKRNADGSVPAKYDTVSQRHKVLRLADDAMRDRTLCRAVGCTRLHKSTCQEKMCGGCCRLADCAPHMRYLSPAGVKSSRQCRGVPACPQQFKGACAHKMCRGCCIKHQTVTVGAVCGVHRLTVDLPVGAVDGGLAAVNVSPAYAAVARVEGRDIRIVLNQATHTYTLRGVAAAGAVAAVPAVLLQSVTAALELVVEPFDDVRRRLVGYVRGGQLARQKRTRRLENQRVLGVRLHRLAEKWWRLPDASRAGASAWSADPAWAQLLTQFAVWTQDGWQLFRSEMPVYDEQSGIAGTPDLILWRPNNNDGAIRDASKFMIVDFKRSASMNPKRKANLSRKDDIWRELSAEMDKGGDQVWKAYCQVSMYKDMFHRLYLPLAVPHRSVDAVLLCVHPALMAAKLLPVPDCQRQVQRVLQVHAAAAAAARGAAAVAAAAVGGVADADAAAAAAVVVGGGGGGGGGAAQDVVPPRSILRHCCNNGDCLWPSHCQQGQHKVLLETAERLQQRTTQSHRRGFRQFRLHRSHSQWCKRQFDNNIAAYDAFVTDLKSRAELDGDAASVPALVAGAIVAYGDNPPSNWIVQLVNQELQREDTKLNSIQRIRPGQFLMHDRLLVLNRQQFQELAADDMNDIGSANPFVGLSDTEFASLASFPIARSRRGNDYSLHLPPREVPTAPLPGGMACIDPGGRKMLTIVDPTTGKVVIWGKKEDLEAVENLDLQIADLQCRTVERTADDPRRYTHSHQRRHMMRKAKLRLFQRKGAMMDDLHRKMIKYLCETYSVILLPEFRSKGMVARRDRVLGKQSVKTLLSWRHFAFRKRLIDKAKRYPHCRVIIVDEAWTTVTCHQCGNVRHKFAEETFRCTNAECEFVCDRDVNAGINIGLKYLTEHANDPALAAWMTERGGGGGGGGRGAGGGDGDGDDDDDDDDNGNRNRKRQKTVSGGGVSRGVSGAAPTGAHESALQGCGAGNCAISSSAPLRSISHSGGEKPSTPVLVGPCRSLSIGSRD